MRIWPFSVLTSKLIGWLMEDHESSELAVCDFDRVSYELKPCDVILVEGRSRVSEVIKITTRSNWSHAALYIGRISDIEDDHLRKKVRKHYKGNLQEQLVIEGILGKGIIVSSLHIYEKDHVRICRPGGIAQEDANKVIAYCINELGREYNVRSILDLLRLLFPITFMPRYLFSSIMDPIKSRKEHKDICSTLLSKAFASVKYPLLPHLHRDKKGKITLIPRNPALFTPKDFDYSPYFEIIKYPLFGFSEQSSYKHFPWGEEGVYSNDSAGLYVSEELTEKAKSNYIVEAPSSTPHYNLKKKAPYSEKGSQPPSHASYSPQSLDLSNVKKPKQTHSTLAKKKQNGDKTGGEEEK